MGYQPKDPMTRFYAKVPVRNAGECWIWMGAKKSNGYGNFYFHQSYYNAHRASWELHVGPIDKGLLVLHKCDNRGCVNPDHLFLGSQLENIQDMDRKGRRGSGNRKLDGDDVADIRARLLSGEMARSIAKSFGVCEATISVIRSGKTWRETNDTIPREAGI